MKLDFCVVCGRIVLRGFSYCPYCGTVLNAGPEFEDVINEPFDRLDRSQANFRGRRIDELLDELVALEIDMEEILHGLAQK
ncbi:MAG: zinc ribbon domain-containing protein [Spirochaetales bacterium]|nr:MAG: zinc ribbon domain-containing protein [Spirochaetales bacterium]